jgi:hypothetical protein
MIVVDNTNTTIAEIAPYVAIAEAYSYEVEIVQIGNLDDESLKLYASRNTHGVPYASVVDMARRIAECQFPSRWRVSKR